MKHKHRYKIIKVKSLPFFTEYFLKKCKCGKKLEYYQNPCGKIKING